MASLSDYREHSHEHAQVVKFALDNLGDYKSSYRVLKTNTELLWEEIVGSVKRYYRINTFQIEDVPGEARFALDPGVDLRRTIAEMGLSRKTTKCALELLDLIEKQRGTDKFVTVLDQFLDHCESELDSRDDLNQFAVSARCIVPEFNGLDRL